MAGSEYKELMEFISRQFEKVDERFKGVYEQLAGMATKDDLASTRDEIVTAKEEVMRHTGVLIEAVDHKIDLLVEGRMATHERIDRDKEENEVEHARMERTTLINTADISGLDKRVGKLEGRV